MKKITLFLIILFAVSGALSADIYVKNMKKTAEFQMMGKNNPEKVEIEEQWLSKEKFSVITKELTIVGDFQKKKMYFIIHKLKQYYLIPTDIAKEKLSKIAPQKIADIITSIKVNGVKVNLRGPQKKVANWNCQAYDLEMTFMIPEINIMPQFKIRMWMTKDIPFNYKAYMTGISDFFGSFVMNLVNLDEEGQKEMERLEKIEGFQVAGEVVVSVFGTQIKSASQVMEVVEKQAPAGTYSIPAGYQLGTFGLPQNK